jgi:hypothetical protein
VHRRTRRSLASYALAALLVLHLDPGGLVLCVKPDGSRAIELGCGCGTVAVEPTCACCHKSPPASGSATLVADSCGGCSDFAINLLRALDPAAPSLQLLLIAVVPQVQWAPEHGSSMLSGCAAGFSLPPPPLLSRLQLASIVLRV